MDEGVKFLEGGVHSSTLAEGTTDYAAEGTTDYAGEGTADCAGEVHVIHCSPSLETRPFARGGRFWERAYIHIVPR